MKLATLLATPIVALGIAACGSTTVAPTAVAPTPTAVAPTLAPTVAPTVAPTPTFVASGGYGDTAVNPDSTYACAFSITEGGTVVAFITYAGNDPAMSAVCSGVSQPGWAQVNTIQAGSYVAAPGCFWNYSAGITERLYQAIPGGSADMTAAGCSGLLS